MAEVELVGSAHPTFSMGFSYSLPFIRGRVVSYTGRKMRID
jgi:hypothetical protein